MRTYTIADVNKRVVLIDVAKNTDEIRAYVSLDLKRRIKAIVGLKNSGRDWTMSDIVAEALEDWLQKPENLALTKRHKLDQME